MKIEINTKVDYQFNNNESSDEKMKIIKKTEKIFEKINCFGLEIEARTIPSDKNMAYTIKDYVYNGQNYLKIEFEFCDNGLFLVSDYSELKNLVTDKSKKEFYYSNTSNLLDYFYGNSVSSGNYPKFDLEHGLAFVNLVIRTIKNDITEN